MKTGEGWGGYIISKFVRYFQKYGTLLDRDYEWIRQGKDMTTSYELLPEDPSTLNETVVLKIKRLPSLTDFIEKGAVPSVEEVRTTEKSSIPLLERLRKEKKQKQAERAISDED